MANASTFSATDLVRRLDPDELRRLIRQNESERKALLVLLRAAQAADRKKQKERGDGK
jgi:hypothetical protein